jgi:hypothetical protein
MATQAVEGLAELAAAVSRNEAPRLNETRPLLSPDTKQKTERLYRGSRLVGWLVFLGMGAGFLIVLLKS